MNRKLVKTIALLGVILALVIAFRAGMSFGAGSGEPGSQSDPIVTLSYLEARLGQLGTGEDSGSSGSIARSADAGMKKITLTRGDVLRLESGSLLVVYSGNGTVTGSSGLVNISTSELFSDGMTAVLYSLYMGLGSDCALTAGGSMTVYVSGGYSLE